MCMRVRVRVREREREGEVQANISNIDETVHEDINMNYMQNVNTKNMRPEADFAFREAIQSSLVAEYNPLEAPSMALCASFHSCSVPSKNNKKA